MPRLFKKRGFLESSESLFFPFILSFVLLVFLGIIFLTDVSAPQGLRFFGDRFYFLKQQLLSLGIGAALLVLFSLINYRVLLRLSVFIFLFSLVFLVLLLIPGLGQEFLGARRWLFIGSFGFQPSEFVKFALVIYLSSLIEKRKPVLAFLIPLLFVSLLIMLQPDLGTTLVIVAIGLAMIFISGVPLRYFVGTLLISFIMALGAIFTSSYRRDRLFSFLNQIEDPLGKTYHINQIIISLGLGGLWGVGIGNSRQKYLFLPEAATDSIFAVIAEEIGFFGSLVLIFLFAYFFYRGFRIALRVPDNFGKSLVFGFLSWMAIQAFLNLASMTALLPLTGIPLPFFSYGGSSLISLMMAVGVIINVSRSIQGKTLVMRRNFLRR